MITVNPEYKRYVQEKISNFFREFNKKFPDKNPVFVCIGTPRVSGDAIGPFIGNALRDLGYKVYGTTHSPVDAFNVKLIYKRLWFKEFLNTPIIAIDACVTSAPMGYIDYDIGEGLTPGSAMGKDLGRIGNSAIRIGTVNNKDDIKNVDINRISIIAGLVSSSIHNEMIKRIN